MLSISLGNNLCMTLLCSTTSGCELLATFAISKNLPNCPLLSKNPTVFPKDIGEIFWL